MMKIVFIGFGTLGVLIGAVFIIFAFAASNAVKKSREVTATVVDVVSRKERRKRGPCRTVYSPVYEYYDGEYKRYKSSMSSTFEVKPGTGTTLYISEDGKIREQGTNVFMIVFGAIFAFAGLIFLAAALFLI